MKYNELLHIKYKEHLILKIIIFLFLVIIILSLLLKVYDTYTIYGVYCDNKLLVDVETTNSDFVTGGTFIKINNNNYEYKVDSISSLKVANNVNYNEYEILIPKTFKENEVIKITFYKNKEILIKKIVKTIF